ncbi:hypothetical protein Pve01_64900 [Planomonospora venezuelensis]|nr:hypothetical protein Pve01_64900 [Planomonospora venezuelensis]
MVTGLVLPAGTALTASCTVRWSPEPSAATTMVAEGPAVEDPVAEAAGAAAAVIVRTITEGSVRSRMCNLEEERQSVA